MHQVITISILLGASIGLVSLVASDITNPISYTTSCIIQQFDVFDIGNNSYWIDMILYNNGDNTITKYVITSDEFYENKTGVILSGDSMSYDFITNTLEDEFITVTAYSEFDETICVTEVEL